MNAFKTVSVLTLSVFATTALGCSQNLNPVLTQENLDSQLANTMSSKSTKNGDIIPGEFIVKFKTNSTNSISALSDVGAKSVRTIGDTGMQLIKISTNVNAMDNLKDKVEWIEPNRVIKITVTNPKDVEPEAPSASYPNDPMFAKQYAHKVSNSVEGWKITKGDSKLIVAIVDTGVDGNHPDLKSKVVPGFDSFNPNKPESAYKDPQGHGTHCAGIAAGTGNNKIGITGFAPDVKIQSVRVLDESGSGSYESVAQGIAWAATNGAKVISMSLGGPSASKAIEEACKLAFKNDALVVAAMGNDGDDSLSYPAAIKGVMSVGATDSANKIASFSQYGKHISVSAPGVDILSTFPTYTNGIGMKNYGSISGTSMATPGVAGLAALVRSKFPALKAAQVRAKIEKSCDDLGTKGFDNYYGFGRINVAKALK